MGTSPSNYGERLIGRVEKRHRLTAAVLLASIFAGAPQALAQQANFLKDQGRLTSVAPDFSKNVTTEWVTKAQ